MATERNVVIIPTSHLDLFWLGDYRNCLERGEEVIRDYLDRAIESGDETFVIDTTIFAEYFLAQNPQYEGPIRMLIEQGRLEIGAAYIDRWENLVLGESIIRNIQIGRAWGRDRLGIDIKLAAHPDLPGLNAQTGQIYAQAGIDYYVTSRKLFQEGRVWRHRAPDGTAMTMLTWPEHYVFIPLGDSGLHHEADGVWFAPETRLSYDDVAGRYPHGTIAVSGSAGDLTKSSDFTERYGQDLRDYVAKYRSEDPELTIGYAIPATVLAPYLNTDTELAEVSGSIPSVWGVAPDEEMRFFHRVRALEALLLDAETASAIGIAAGRAALPDSSSNWRGLFAEDAYFASDDTPPEGKEWEWLWRMHVFTQDHNGGGQDGPLSIFQKKVRHDRMKGYALEVVDHALGGGDTEQPSILRTRLGRSATELLLDADVTAALLPWLENLPAGTWQPLAEYEGSPTVALNLVPAHGVSTGPLEVSEVIGGISCDDAEQAIAIQTEHLQVSVDRATGTVTITEKATGAQWPVPVGAAYAVPELGNDVTLKTDEDGRVDATVESVELLDGGPVLARVRIRWILLDVVWTTTVRIWGASSRVDIDTQVDWPGFEKWQIRMPMAAVGRAAVTHGTPFHASGWLDVPVEQQSRMPDEISQENIDSYREIQHWAHLRSANAESGLAIITTHPAFRHDGESLEAVLLRTAPSCGDPRMAWTNPGRTVWSFCFIPTSADWQRADVPELADISWRSPRVIVGGGKSPLELLNNTGEDVRLSALFAEGNDISARLVNQSDSERTVRLRGAAVGVSADLVDLDGRVQSTLDAVDGELVLTLPAWRIQTIRLGTPSNR